MRLAHADLERRVEARTQELAAVNETLRQEIGERQRAQAELVEHETQLRELAAEVVLAEQRERRSLAERLHDEIGQLLAVSQMKIDRLRDLDDRAARAEQCDSVERLVEKAIARTRSMTVELTPPVLYECGLSEAVEWLTGQVKEMSGVSATVERQGEPVAVSEDVSLTLFHAVRELLANVTKHAKASRVTVTLKWDPSEVAVVVEDDGVGVDRAALAQRRNSTSFGLFSIRERLRRYGGGLQVERAGDKGSRMTVSLPLSNKVDRDGG